MKMDVNALESKMIQAAGLMNMLSQPMRLRILCILLEGQHSVLDLADQVGLSQPAMSHHLKKLRDSGLVKTERDRQTIYYSLQGNEVETIMQTLYDLYCKEV